jgi:hypothetical protein
VLQAGSPYTRAYDRNRVVVAIREEPPLSPEPQPVYLLDLETGDMTELGQAVRGWLVRVNATGYVTFLTDDSIEVIHPLLDTRSSVLPRLEEPEAEAYAEAAFDGRKVALVEKHYSEAALST